MERMIKARFTNGVIVPSEPVDIPEDTEIVVTIKTIPTPYEKEDPLDMTFGGWIKTIDCEELKRDIYADRHISHQKGATT